MEGSSDAAFIAEYVEPQTKLVKRFVLSFWEKDGSVSLYDPAVKRVFLRRIVPSEHIKLAGL
jgi:hypothetical protein